ncbi:MAG: hypothetical protein EAX95_07715 [Candidatus Thorarchaeota archaeon]|nr:hypothetical protein [Candidatus Thorarchaeota archaeon]
MRFRVHGDCTQSSVNQSPFRPTRRMVSGEATSLLRLGIAFYLLMLVAMPMVGGGSSASATPVAVCSPPQSITSQSGDLFQYSLPGSNIQVATGSVLGYHGFAYVVEVEAKLYFFDPVQNATLSIDFPIGDTDYGSGLTGVDYDNDGNTEFVFRDYYDSSHHLILADIDDDTVSVFRISFNLPSVVGVGDFNGDTFPDVAVRNNNVNTDILILDLQHNATLAHWLSNDSQLFAVGRFASATEDSLAIISRWSGSPRRNLTVVDGSGAAIQSLDTGISIEDIATFHHGAGYDEIALVDSSGDLTVRYGNTPGILFNQPIDPLASSNMYVDTGFFNSDGQEDLVVVSRSSETAFFRDGNMGFSIGQTDEVFIFSHKRLGTGYIDQDALSDLAIAHVSGGLGIIRGADRSMAYIEYLIDIRTNIGSYQILLLDVNTDGRVDVVCRVGDMVFIVLSDTSPPELDLQPIKPAHPTILDDYVEISVIVSESTIIEESTLFVKAPGDSIFTEYEMYESHTSSRYYAFVSGLQPGGYLFYIEFRDVFLNVGALGSVSAPLEFEVVGHSVWEVDKTDGIYFGPGSHLLDMGNLSDGSSVLYTLSSDKAGELTLAKYSLDGMLLDNLTIIPTLVEYYEVYAMMLNDDNVTDVLVLAYYYEKPPITEYYAFHGSNLSLIGQGQTTETFKTFRFVEVFDDDGDGLEELFALDEAGERLAKMDSDLSWIGADLPASADNPLGFALLRETGVPIIALARGNLRIELYNGMTLNRYRVLDAEIPTYSSQEFIQLSRYHNSTLGRDLFIAGYTYWDASVPLTRFYIFNEVATSLIGDVEYTIPNENLLKFYPSDSSEIGADGVFIITSGGDLRLATLSSSLSTLWSTAITQASPLSMLVTDFDGDSKGEFVLFTDQDEMLTSVSIEGEIEWAVKIGEVHHPIAVGNIDLGFGTEIAAYPASTRTTTKLIVIRNLDTYYQLDVTAAYQPTDVVQGSLLKANVTVTNIHGEYVEDAVVSMIVQYTQGGEQINNPFGFYYDGPNSKYRMFTEAIWPIGIANVSFGVDHQFYHSWSSTILGGLTVRSDLDVKIFPGEAVLQGEDQIVEVQIQDNLGFKVANAEVFVDVEGLAIPATFDGKNYVAVFSNVTLPTGPHQIIATANHPFANESIKTVSFTVHTTVDDLIYTESFPSSIAQGQYISAWLNITDKYSNPFVNAKVTIRIAELSAILPQIVPGCYLYTGTLDVGIGLHNLEISAEHEFTFGAFIGETPLVVTGDLKPIVVMDTIVTAGENFEIDVFVQDSLRPVIAGAEVTIEVHGVNYTATMDTENPARFLADLLADLPVGQNFITVYVSAEYASDWSATFPILVKSTPVLDVFYSNRIVQGEATEIRIQLEDWRGSPVTGATVNLNIRASTRLFSDFGNGTYVILVSTTGWNPLEYNFSITANHPYLEYQPPYEGVITVSGLVEISVNTAPDTLVAGSAADIIVNVQDLYGNPLPGLQVEVALGIHSVMAEETDLAGEYIAHFAVIEVEHWGDNSIQVMVNGELVGENSFSEQHFVSAAVPDLSLSPSSLTVFGAGSFLISIIGLLIYFRIAASMRVKDKSDEGMKKTVRSIDRLYMGLVTGSGLTLAASWSAAAGGEYLAALALAVLLLGISVLLYGLWLYRDAMASVFVKNTLDRRRMVLGLWHLFFVPVVIWMIFTYGTHVEWFDQYILAQSLQFEGIRIPTIMTTIFAAYVSSILIVVINLYREIGKGMKRIERMIEADTPAEIVEEERALMTEKFGSSIRVKFLMFLVVIAATTVMSMDFLKSYSLAVIILIPVVFLVVIPFLTSKILQVFGKASSVFSRKKSTVE